MLVGRPPGDCGSVWDAVAVGDVGAIGSDRTDEFAERGRDAELFAESLAEFVVARTRRDGRNHPPRTAG